MKRSTSRILTTHAGSLPRPPDLAEMLIAADAGRPVDRAALIARSRSAVAETVQKQRDAGIDVLNDGEMGKIGYSTYVKDRLTGFEGENRNVRIQGEARDFPEWSERRLGGLQFARPACNGPIAWKDFDAVRRDIDDLRAATGGGSQEEVFMTAASPGVIAIFLPNDYYPTQEQYLQALADVMRDEYRAIVEAGFTLQLDCPDLAMARHLRFPDATVAEFRNTIEQHVEVLNDATKGLPAEQIRVHLCWGNYEGPHHMDVAIRDIIDIVFKANCGAVSFEGANPRHDHEWAVWNDVRLPEGKLLIPGVIDSTTNFIEHPELVAQRIGRYASAVGRENVVAGVDCGFGTFATVANVDTRIVWAKLASLAEGARIATKELWA